MSQTERYLRFVTGYSPTFMPMLPFSVHDLMWYPRKFFEVFNYPGGFFSSGLAALCFVVGFMSKFLREPASVLCPGIADTDCPFGLWITQIPVLMVA